VLEQLYRRPFLWTKAAGLVVRRIGHRRRGRRAIAISLDVLRDVLPVNGVIHCERNFPALGLQPSDPELDALPERRRLGKPSFVTKVRADQRDERGCRGEYRRPLGSIPASRPRVKMWDHTNSDDPVSRCYRPNGS
jgi:hypothetical protein